MSFSLTDYMERHLRKEIDFINEAYNAETAWKNIQAEPDLRDHVHIPRVYWDFTSARVLVTEWIDRRRPAHRHRRAVTAWGQGR